MRDRPAGYPPPGFGPGASSSAFAPALRASFHSIGSCERSRPEARTYTTSRYRDAANQPVRPNAPAGATCYGGGVGGEEFSNTRWEQPTPPATFPHLFLPTTET